MRRQQKNPHAELCAWANGLRPDSIRSSGPSIAQLDRLLSAARQWVTFQDPDSLYNQKDDPKLQAAAIEARERLIDAIENIG